MNQIKLKKLEKDRNIIFRRSFFTQGGSLGEVVQKKYLLKTVAKLKKDQLKQLSYLLIMKPFLTICHF